MMFDKLGKDYTRKILYLDDNYNYHEVAKEEEGYFFAESTYIIDLKGANH